MLALRALYAENGYALYKMSKFEEYELYLKNKEFLVSDNVITFTDTDGRLLALKPDVTLSIIKNSRPKDKELIKAQYNENVYRVSGSTHTFKEIMQSGIECIGEIGDREIAEVLSLASQSLASLSEDYVIEISSLDLVCSVLAAFGITDSALDGALDLIGRKNSNGLEAFLGERGISDSGIELALALTDIYGSPETVIPKLDKFRVNAEASSAADKLIFICRELMKTTDSAKISIDFSLIGNMNYYNGIAFKGFVLGIPTAVLIGGQYDNLLKKMGKTSRGIGFAVYLDGLDRLPEA
jgi:ATP phosphoribosyltransferase regulatory subunit